MNCADAAGVGKSCSGCNGACCVAFVLSKDLAYLEAHANTVEDGWTLLDMLEPISLEEARERRLAVGSPLPVNPKRQHYTCNRWDPFTRRCSRYDERPHMCRHYPGEDPCDHSCGLPGRAAVRQLFAAQDA